MGEGIAPQPDPQASQVRGRQAGSQPDRQASRQAPRQPGKQEGKEAKEEGSCQVAGSRQAAGGKQASRQATHRQAPAEGDLGQFLKPGKNPLCLAAYLGNKTPS